MPSRLRPRTAAATPGGDPPDTPTVSVMTEPRDRWLLRRRGRGQQHVVDEDPGQVNVVRVQRVHLDQVLYLGEHPVPGHAGHRVKVPRGQAEPEVSLAVPLERFDQAEVGDDAVLEHVVAAAEIADFAFGKTLGGR